MSTSSSRGNEVVAFSREIRTITKTAAITPESQPLWKRWFNIFLDSNIFQIFMTVVTLYALFGNDIFVLCKPADSSDVVINVLDFITFLVFALEFLMQCAAKKNYILPPPLSSLLPSPSSTKTMSSAVLLTTVLHRVVHHSGREELLGLLQELRALFE
jgi:hypothetical protein